MVQATPLNLLVKSHLALLLCNIIWACDYPFYNLVLSKYVAPIALVTASLCAAALFSLVPLLWSKAKPIARKDIKTMIGAALLIGVIRKVLLMYGLSRTSPIDGSIIDTITPLLVLLISVVLGIDKFTRLKIAGLVLGMAGAVGVVLLGASGGHTHSGLVGNLMIAGLRPGYFLLHGLVQKVDRQVRCRHHVALGLLSGGADGASVRCPGVGAY